MHDAVIDPSAAETQRINLLTSELRAEVTRVMASVVRTPESVKVVQDLMCRAQALDRQVSVWMRSVPEAWRPRTVCWQLHNLGGSDHSRAEVFPGRVDVYTDLYIASVWNMMRTTRLVLMSIAVRCAAWVCSPVDYRTTPEYATAARSCVDTITDILASVPYHLGWHVKREGSSGFACGEDSGMKGLAGYFLSWPLACVMSQDYATDARTSPFFFFFRLPRHLPIWYAAWKLTSGQNEPMSKADSGTSARSSALNTPISSPRSVVSLFLPNSPGPTISV